jgi:hypothetical protein
MYKIPWGISKVVWKTLIDHYTISQDDPEANKLPKWMAQTVKQGLQKYGLHKGHIQHWD